MPIVVLFCVVAISSTASAGENRTRPQTIAPPAAENAFLIQAGLGNLELFPRPQQAQFQEGTLPVVTDGQLVLEVAASAKLRDGFSVEQLQRSLRVMTGQAGLQLQVVDLEAAASKPRLTLAQAPVSAAVKALCARAGLDLAGLKPQGYVLGFVGGATPGAVIVGADLSGVVYGSSTFIQLLHKQGGNITAREARITDWPATPRRGVRSIGVSEDTADWCAFYKMNALLTAFDRRQPVPESLRKLSQNMARRGIVLLSECRMGAKDVPFIFTNPADRQAILDRVREAIAMGLPSLAIAVDDEPNAPQSPQDVAKYGPGLVGLGKAQMEMMSEVGKVAGDRLEIVFCPRVYYDPHQKGVYPTQPSADEVEYTRLVGTLPANIQLWTAQPKPSYVAELNRLWGRKPYIYHNLFYSYLVDHKLYFLAYPVPTPELLERVQGFTGSGTGPRYPREWRVNYLGLAGNTWNPSQPVGLREAFVREYGEPAAPLLLEYAKDLGSDLKPGVPLMADVWDQPDVWPGVASGLGSAGRLHGLKANQANIARLRRAATAAHKAATIAWDRSGLNEEQTQVLQQNARRIELNYATVADMLTIQMDLKNKRPANNKVVLARALKQAKEIRSIIDALTLNRDGCGDWRLLDQVENLERP